MTTPKAKTSKTKRETVAIEMAPQPAHLEPQFAELVKLVKLRDVRLIETHAKVDAQVMKEDGELQLFVQPTQTRAGLSGATLYCGVKLGIKIATASDAPHPMELSAEYGLFYDVPEGRKIATDVAGLFASRNAVFNVWPFFRELVHSTVARMGFPALVLPSFKLSVAPADDGADLAPSSTQ